MKISKNKDITRQISLRLRESDLNQLDSFADDNNWSRTFALEQLIRKTSMQSKTNSSTTKSSNFNGQKPKISNSDEFLTYEQVADQLQVSVSNVRKWVMNRQLKVVRLGHRISRVKREVLDVFIDRRFS